MIKRNYLEINMIVEEIMTKKIITMDCNKTILDACNKYRDTKVGSLIITSEDRLVGIVTERDLIERTICMHRNPETIKIKEIMSKDIKTIQLYDRVEKALDIIKKYKIKKLPVISNEKLEGIITITDIAHSRPDIRKFLNMYKT
jgi:CBS domain-containing protein